MKNLKNVLILITTIAAMALPGAAFAAVHLSLVGGIDDGNPSVSNTPGTAFSSRIGYGGGALLGIHLGASRAELELGALYMVRSWQETTGASVTNFKAPAVEIPLLLRFWLAREISIGVGGYFSEGVGDVTTTPNAGGTSTSMSYSSAGLSNQDYGLVGSLGLRFPIGGMTSIVLDGRYMYGLKNVIVNPAPSQAFNFRDIQGLAGIRFGM